MKVNSASQIAVLASILWFTPPIIAESDQEIYNNATNSFDFEEYELAISEYKKIVDKGKDADIKAKAAFYLAESYFRLKKYKEARDSFKAYLINFPKHNNRAEGQFRISESFYFLEEYAKAAAAYMRYVKDNPKHEFVPEALFSASASFTEVGKYDEALAGYEKIISEHPKSSVRENAAYNLGWVYFRAEKFEESAKAFSEFAEGHKESKYLAQALLRAADAKFKANKFNDALKYYNQVLGKGKGAFRNDAHQGIAWSYYKMNEFDKAANAFMVLGRSFDSKNVDKKAESYYQAVQAYYSSEKFQEGIAAADELIKQCPKVDLVGDALYWRGLFFRKLDQFDRAAQSLKEAMAKKNTKVTLSEIKMELGNVYFNLEKYAEAEKILLDAISGAKTAKIRNQINFDLARALHELGKTDEALKRAVLVKDEGDADPKLAVLAKFSMGEFEFAKENYDSALSYYQIALDKAKDEKLKLDSVYRMGWCYKLLDKADQSLNTFMRLQREHPKNEYAREVRYLIGGLYDELKKPAEAKKIWGQLIAEDGEYSADSYLALADLEFKGEQYKTVIKLLKQFLSKYGGNELANEAHYLLAEAAFQNGDKVQALDSYSRVIAGKDKTLRESSLYGRAWIYYENKQSVQAINDLDRLSKEYPNTSYRESVAQLKSKILASGKDYDKAKSVLKEALSNLKEGDDGESIVLNLATIETETKNYDEALSLYDRFLKDYPNSKKKGRVLYEKGWLLMQVKKTSEATAVFKAYKNSYAKGELIFDVEFALGELAYDQEKFKEALVNYKACQNDKRYKDKSYYKQAWSYFKLKDFDQAAATFAKLVKECAESHLYVESVYREGLSYVKGGKFDKADQSLTSFLTVGRQSNLYSEALFNLAKVKEKRGKVQEAKSKYEQYIKQFSEGESRANAEFRLAKILLQFKEFALARNHFNVVLKDKAHYLALESQYGVGETYYFSKQYDDAIKSYLKTLLYKDGKKWQAASMLRIAQSHKFMKRSDKAIKYLKKLQETYPASEEAKTAADELQRLDG